MNNAKSHMTEKTCSTNDPEPVVSVNMNKHHRTASLRQPTQNNKFLANPGLKTQP